MCVFPGLLPPPGSKTLWLSQRCSLIYPLTLCLSLHPPSLSQTHSSISPSHSCSHLFFLPIKKRNTYSPLKQYFLKWTSKYNDKTSINIYPIFLTPFLLISPSAYFPFSSLLNTLISFILFISSYFPSYWLNAHIYKEAQCSGLTRPWPVCVCVLSVCFVDTANWCNTATMWPAMPANLMLSAQAVSPLDLITIWDEVQDVLKCFIWSVSAAFLWKQQIPQIKSSQCASSAFWKCLCQPALGLVLYMPILIVWAGFVGGI